MMWKETRAQGAIEMALAVGIAIFLATIVGLILKGITNRAQVGVQSGTNAVVNKIN